VTGLTWQRGSTGQREGLRGSGGGSYVGRSRCPDTESSTADVSVHGGCRGSGDQPSLRAIATAANCELTPNFWRIDLIWERTVDTDTPDRAAISSA